MMGKRAVTIVAATLLAVLFAGSALASRKVESLRGQEATLEEVLYLPSSKALRRLSLGHTGLLANVYWTRAVQYFGTRVHVRSARYDLLAPLLDITTDLDPHLVVAYETGSIFLSQKPPRGAGQPDKAVALVEKGIRENPGHWRLYFTLGFIHYLDRHDYRAAQEAFQKGSEVPGALPWMKVMAARMAEHASDIGTALALWQAVYDTNTQKDLRETAWEHIVSLQADAAIEVLERRVLAYRERTKALPASWHDLIRAGLLPGIPVDPTGAPFKLMPDGTVQVVNPERFPFLGEARKKALSGGGSGI